MNVRNKNFVYMLNEVEKVLDENRPVWEVESRLIELNNTFKAKLQQLRILLVQKDELERPFSEVREEVLSEFANKIVQLAGFLHEISIEKGSKNMTVYTDLNRSSLIHGSIQDCLTKSKAILDYAETMETELSSFSNGMSVLEEAVAQYQAFRDNGLMPYDRRNRLRDVNADLKGLLLELRDFLADRIDKVILFFMDAAPRFFEKYSLARVIPNIAGSRKTGAEEDIQDEDLPDHEGEESDDASETGVDSTDTESPPVEEDSTDANDGSTEDDSSSDDESDLV